MPPALAPIRQLGAGEVLRGGQWPKHLMYTLKESCSIALNTNHTVVLPLLSSSPRRNGKLPERLIKVQADHHKFLLDFCKVLRITMSSRVGSGRTLSSFVIFPSSRRPRNSKEAPIRLHVPILDLGSVFFLCARKKASMRLSVNLVSLICHLPPRPTKRRETPMGLSVNLLS